MTMAQTPSSNPKQVTHRRTKKARSRKMAKASVSNPAPYGTMTILPKEIRSSIYAFVLAGGDMALTRTSRYFYMDTKEELTKHGACHVRINRKRMDYDLYTYIRPPRKHRAKAQNLDLENKLSGSHTSNPYHSDRRLSVEDSVEDILQGLVSGMRRLKKCSLTIAFSKLADLEKFNSQDLNVLKAFQSFHVNISMRLRVHHQSYIVKAASGVGDAGTKLAMSIKSLLKPEDCQESGPKLTIIRTLYIGEPL